MDYLSADCKETWSVKEPYLVKVFHPILPQRFFATLRAQFPAIHELRSLNGVGYKRCATDGKRGGLLELIRTRPAWQIFHQSVITSELLLDFAKQHFNVLNHGRIKQRCELSILQSDGGSILPHPDTAKKLVTVVIYLTDEDWDPAWGGEFAMVIPKVPVDDTVGYPRIRFSEVELAYKIPFKPNTAVFMQRSARSFHAVYPVIAPAGRHRKSITVNFMGKG